MSMRTNEPSARRRVDEREHVAVRELLVEREPEVRQLERDVRAQALSGEAFEHLLVGGHDGRGRGLAR